MTDTLKNLIDVAEGRAPADMLITNVRIVDVYGHRVVGGRVAVAGGCIASVLFDDRDAAVPDPAAAEIVDGAGRYLTPGLIDGHLHIESSNIRPAEYARMALARGTTCAIADSHEIANVAGTGGLSFMIEDARRAPLAIKFMMPSCVPALPDEQAGAEISAADMRAFMAAHPGEVFGLGEMMNTPGVFAADGELVDGHAPLVVGADLNAYAAAGIIADHECTDPAEALDKLSRGMYLMLREGTCSHDLDVLVREPLDELPGGVAAPVVNIQYLPFRHFAARFQARNHLHQFAGGIFQHLLLVVTRHHDD